MIHRVFIDTHCHLDVDAFDLDRDKVVSRAIEVGVQKIVVPAIDPRTWEKLGVISTRYLGVKIAVGIHPQLLPEVDESVVADGLARLSATATALNAIAIGEVGFDGPVAMERGVSLETQERIVDAHLEVARALELPVLLHIFRAHEFALRSLKRHTQVRGVVHSYSGSADLVREYVKLGLHISFAGAITRPNARRTIDAARVVPEDRLLIETDAPDQAPHGATTHRNEPSYLPLIAASVAQARNESLDHIAEITTRNACTLFGAKL